MRCTQVFLLEREPERLALAISDDAGREGLARMFDAIALGRGRGTPRGSVPRRIDRARA